MIPVKLHEVSPFFNFQRLEPNLEFEQELIRLRRFLPARRELPEPGARNFACGANYLAPGWFNFACGANYPLPAPGTKGGYFVFVWRV